MHRNVCFVLRNCTLLLLYFFSYYIISAKLDKRVSVADNVLIYEPEPGQAKELLE